MARRRIRTRLRPLAVPHERVESVQCPGPRQRVIVHAAIDLAVGRVDTDNGTRAAIVTAGAHRRRKRR